MGKIMALDLGDQWIGIALTDISRMLARPYTTVPVQELEAFLTKTSKDESIDLIVVGYPKTMRGGESEQTLKVVAHTKKLEEAFPQMKFILWDERLSSKRAQQIGRKRKEDKLKEHARAAAFILDSYISYLEASKEEAAN